MPRDLETYRAKRNFRQTSEPEGHRGAERGQGRFVVQKHAASHLHYDFRLELDGVLLSWAVPKGPSLDPSDRRLAVHVEDHPLEYAEFEGTIPSSEYGGGTVMIWDRGTWEAKGDPREAYERGRLVFGLAGERLKGGWSLFRTKGGDHRQWLLVKRKDEAARRGDVLKEETRSVASGRSMKAIREGDSATRSARRGARRGGGRKREEISKLDAGALPGARRASLPAFFEPQKASPAERVPAGEDWLHEIKFDGYRLLAFVEGERVRLFTRRGKDWSARFSEIAAALCSLGLGKALLDGEVVAPGESGRTSFQALQKALRAGSPSRGLVYFAFDLLHHEGCDLRKVPLVKRKRALRTLFGGLDSGPHLRLSDHVRGGGSAFFDFACAEGLEGVVSKKAAARYQSGRSRTWLKVKCTRRQEFVVGGFSEPRGSRFGFGALLLGVYDNEGALRYAGRVGTGFDAQSLTRIARRLESLERKTPPFADPPDARGVHWVSPKLVVEVAFAEWTEAAHLRQPAFLGLREDKEPREVRRESPEGPPARSDTMKSSKPKTRSSSNARRDRDASVRVGGVALTHPERVLFPEQGVTKRELAEYYERVAELMLPHVAERPLMLLRCPEGHREECFYQKHVEHALPEGSEAVRVREKSKTRDYLFVRDLRGLVGLVQLGTLELHPWGSRSDEVDAPDRIVFDLDPAEGLDFSRVVEGARRLRDVLSALGLESFVRTTGGKGVHVVVPLRRGPTWERVKAFSAAVARELADAYPGEYVTTMSKSAREDRVFIDHFRNARGATAIASYSSRARAGAPVAAPLRWDELSASMARERFSVERMPRRVAALKEDPWGRLVELDQRLTKAMLKAVRAGS